MLFFPANCLVCGKGISMPGVVLCYACELGLPRNHWGHWEKSPVSQIFWGRVPVLAGTSLFRFEKGSAYQTLVHDLKYRGNRRAGLYLGRLLGRELQAISFPLCDFLVPVPLHRKRLRQRGYNQSELIARGVSEISGIPVACDLLKRKKYQGSQTSMSREGRFHNMYGSFSLSGSLPDLTGKRILLIDDIITTGATLEACSSALLGRYDCQVYIATVSFA